MSNSAFSEYEIELVPLKHVRHLFEQGHYLKRAHVGRQVNYALTKNGCLVGAICYALPMMKTGYLSYNSNQMAELARLYLVDNVKGLAVWFMAATMRRIKKDWAELFPIAIPVEILVSWHDTVRHKGTVYKAANFTFLKFTKPRKRGKNRYGDNFKGTRTYTQDDANIKGAWVFPLSKSARKEVGAI